ncbi:MAG: hypothetical protein V7L21_30495 [Nostoc sp.]|uniref:hypothetical protein n=1 Tax=unclassified Nostoc TaxID=2593658 RepID=UPI0025D684AA|nr:hypothetical protein [Nostoc sp. NMS9]MBN3938652.1 hypothetical protein [Nostoc sp. NMS9]
MEPSCSNAVAQTYARPRAELSQLLTTAFTAAAKAKSDIPYDQIASANARLNQGQDLHSVHRISLYSSITFCV